MNWRALRDVKFWLLAGALALLIAAAAAPRIAVTRPAYNILAVVDITGSMNVRDYVSPGGQPESRLDFTKRALRRVLETMPCQSVFSLGVFTERRSFMLIEPVEVCENFAALDGTIAGLDWRMAWEGDSYVGKGLGHAIVLAESNKSDLLFISDGHEAPPMPEAWELSFGQPGETRGLIAGAGGRTPSPIPKFDKDGREIGFYGADDVPHETRVGDPPKGAELRPGWHPRNAPYGADAFIGSEHLSSVREDHLRLLASKTGLTYLHLDSGDSLSAALRQAVRLRPVTAAADMSYIPAGLALALLLTLYGILPLLRAMAPRGRRTSNAAQTIG